MYKILIEINWFKGELANSIRKNTNLTFGLYHSLFEWFNPLFLSDVKSGYKNQDFVRVKSKFHSWKKSFRKFSFAMNLWISDQDIAWALWFGQYL